MVNMLIALGFSATLYIDIIASNDISVNSVNFINLLNVFIQNSYIFPTKNGKRKGGGLAVYVNNRWCSPGHITIKDHICSPDIELLAVGLCTYYLPCEFSHAIVVAVYIPPSANLMSACDVIHSTMAGLQTAHPTALIIISGDFKHVSIKKTLLKFTQYVTCKTRGEKTLDLLYANVKDVYTSTSPPTLGSSDHNLVLLTPCYVPLAKRLPVTTKTVSVFTRHSRKPSYWVSPSMIGFIRCMYTPIYTLVWLKSDQISHSRIKTPRLFDW